MSRYPPNWSAISLAVKESANWKCQRCGRQCLEPGAPRAHLSHSERSRLTLCVHHCNYTPEDNRPENLVALCSSCHLWFHRNRRGNVSPGQLSLWEM
ncbi:HNH endonuclease [Baaleninema simplex]|uniref:HNH endonuclease n=1 Tax=Baaleninema simplex TaxID=2862350 RepID=UPI0008FBFA66|nr:HNH endonuclease [Baaleninema simplex]